MIYQVEVFTTDAAGPLELQQRLNVLAPPGGSHRIISVMCLGQFRKGAKLYGDESPWEFRTYEIVYGVGE